jgi:diketogulonate reductase-like aldo/keto reductase
MPKDDAGNELSAMEIYASYDVILQSLKRLEQLEQESLTYEDKLKYWKDKYSECRDKLERTLNKLHWLEKDIELLKNKDSNRLVSVATLTEN